MRIISFFFSAFCLVTHIRKYNFPDPGKARFRINFRIVARWPSYVR